MKLAIETPFRLFLVLIILVFTTLMMTASTVLTLQTSEQIDPFYLKLFEEGKYFYQSGNLESAIENLEIASFGFLDHPPLLFECHFYLLVCNYELKHMDKAEHYYNEIKKLDLEKHLKEIDAPSDLFVKYHDATSHFSLLEERRSALSSSRTNPAAERKKLEDEIDELKKEIKRERKDPALDFRLSEIYLSLNRRKDAKEVLGDLIKEDEKNGRAYLELGKILAREEKILQALAHFENAARYVEGDPELHYETGKAYFSMKQFENSREEFLKVQELDKSYEDTERYLILTEKILQDKS